MLFTICQFPNPQTPTPALRRVVPVARGNIHLGNARFDMHPMIFSGGSRAGRLVSNHVFVPQRAAQFNSGLLGLGVILHSEVESTSLVGKLFQQQGSLAFSRLVDWFPDHTGTEWNARRPAA
jgi:hypothetical protein